MGKRNRREAREEWGERNEEDEGRKRRIVEERGKRGKLVSD